MAVKRKLTKDQTRRIREHVEKLECERLPEYSVSVVVKAETDDNGLPWVVITRVREAAVPSFKL
jgi:hypothetical protein